MAKTQDEHESWNSWNYPGTRQICFVCDEPTGNCEDSSLYLDDQGPFCEECFLKQGGFRG